MKIRVLKNNIIICNINYFFFELRKIYYLCAMKRYELTILLILITLFSVAAKGKWELPEEQMRRLDAAMKEAPKFSHRLVHRIDSVKQELSKPGLKSGAKVDILLKVSGMYRQCMSDSAMLYAKRALNQSKDSDPRRRYLSSLYYVDALGAAGIFDEAIDMLDSLSQLKEQMDARTEYYLAARRVYSNVSGYIKGAANESIYRTKYIECDDSLISLLPPNHDFRQFIIAERMVETGKPNEAKVILEGLMKKLRPEDNIYGMAAYQLASVHRSAGEQTLYGEYLAKAAESDILAGVREGFALPALAVWLYDQKEINAAFKYINYALEEAYKGNARVRMVSMSRWLPAIDEAYRSEISASRNELLVYGVLTSFLLVMLVVLTVLLVREIRRSREAHRILAANSKLKDSYIGNFIGLCSTYSDKYYKLVKLVDRKISSGQASELLAALKSGKIGEVDDEGFYKEIDSVVLTLYPDFVERINELLVPDERVKVQRGDLSPELRIYAFVRLGVTESTKIAKILNYSVHTVYAYRNRMRNKAIDRDNFDENVCKIGIE